MSSTARAWPTHTHTDTTPPPCGCGLALPPSPHGRVLGRGRILSGWRWAWPPRPRPPPSPSANGPPRQLLQYQERFGAALEGLGRAAALAPGWEEPRRRHAHLLDFLNRLCALLANRVRGAGFSFFGGGEGQKKGRRWGWLRPDHAPFLPSPPQGKLRGKRRRGLEGPLPPSLLGPLGRGLRPSPLAALQPGPNPQRVLLGRVLFTLTPPEGVP